MRIQGLCFVLLMTACGSDGNTGGIPDECNPLGGQACLMPWPSMIYAKTDSTSVTGFRLDLPPDAMPVNVDGIAVDPAAFNRRDGFSTLGPILAAFPTGVSPAGLPSFKNPDESLDASASVVVLDMESGERVPLFAEIDQNVMLEEARNLMIRPLARMKPGTRHAVAIRRSVKALDGGDLPVPAAFAAIRDGGAFTHPKFAELKTRTLEAIDALEAAGIPADDLVLAWDFVTVSDEYLRSDLTTMREAALPAIGADGANLTFTATTKSNTPTSFKRYVGTYTSPDFLTDGESDGSIMRRGPDGLPVMQGMRDARYAAIVPNCVTTQPLPRPTIVFGHGLFGSAEEYLDDDFVAELAEDHCFIIIAGDFIGLTSRQIHLAPLAVNDLNKGPQVTEKVEQSIIDFIALEHVVRGPMARAPEFEVGGVSAREHVLHRWLARREPRQHVHGVRPEHQEGCAHRRWWQLVVDDRALQRVGAARRCRARCVLRSRGVPARDLDVVRHGLRAVRLDDDGEERDQGAAVRPGAEEHPDVVHDRRLLGDQHRDRDGGARDGHPDDGTVGALAVGAVPGRRSAR